MNCIRKSWDGVTVCLTRSCEIVENGFEWCFGERVTKCIGDLLLLNCLVTKRHTPNHDYSTTYNPTEVPVATQIDV